MIKNILNIALVLVLLSSCDNKSNIVQTNIAQKPTTPIDDKRKMYVLIDSAINYGNDKAYNKVASYYLIENMGESFFYYAFTMANKYNSSEAYFHVFDIIAHSTPKEPKQALNLMDKRTKNFALYYLLKSYEMGFESARYQVNEIFGKDKIPPKSNYYLQDFSKE